MDFQTIFDYCKLCITEKYADFTGRATRAEYWSFALTVAVITGVLNLIARNSTVFSIISGLLSLALLVPQLAAAWRRLHDTGRNGAWYFIGLIPLVGWIIVIYWLCLPGDPDMNRFGPDPREGGFEG